MTDTLQYKRVTCAKPHTCTWCGGRINKGETARYTAAVDGGDFSSYYMHPECDEAYDISLDADPWCYHNNGIPFAAHERGAPDEGVT